MSADFRVLLPFRAAPPPDWLPQGHANVVRNHANGPGAWSLIIGEKTIIEDIERSLGNWIADQINASRGWQERHERAMLADLLARYPQP